MNTEQIWAMLTSTLLAILGRFASVMNTKRSNKKFDVYKFISEFSVAILIGLIVYYFADWLGQVGSGAFALAGVLGWCGPKAIDMLGTPIARLFGIELQNKERR